MLPELRKFQEMMENILIGLGQPVVKGNERPPRPFLNANTRSYIPERRNIHSEFYGAIPRPLEQEDGINLLQGERSRFMQQAATQVSPPGDMQDSLFFPQDPPLLVRGAKMRRAKHKDMVRAPHLAILLQM